jgi:hypothetical protein
MGAVNSATNAPGAVLYEPHDGRHPIGPHDLRLHLGSPLDGLAELRQRCIDPKVRSGLHARLLEPGG